MVVGLKMSKSTAPESEGKAEKQTGGRPREEQVGRRKKIKEKPLLSFFVWLMVGMERE